MSRAHTARAAHSPAIGPSSEAVKWPAPSTELVPDLFFDITFASMKAASPDRQRPRRRTKRRMDTRESVSGLRLPTAPADPKTNSY